MYIKNISGKLEQTDFEPRKKGLFLPDGIKSLISDIGNDLYILGVGYLHGNDYQICISGKVKEGETRSDAITREMSEELNLIHKNNVFTKFTVKENSFAFCEISNTVLVPNGGEDCRRDIYEDRVVVCVYGKEKEIVEYLKTVEISVENCDNITSIWAESSEKIKNYLSINTHNVESLNWRD